VAGAVEGDGCDEAAGEGAAEREGEGAAGEAEGLAGEEGAAEGLAPPGQVQEETLKLAALADLIV
jgi:hypothetical protein